MNFKVIAFVSRQTKNTVRKLCSFFQEKGMVFDAVYILNRQRHSECNFSHPLLDFWDEDRDFAVQCDQTVVILQPDTLTSKSRI